MAGDLDVASLLERFVAASAELTGARYGAINIVDDTGTSITFVQTGVDPATVAALGHPPHAWGVLGSIPDQGVLRLDDLTDHPHFRGLPAAHPPMGPFLGAAVRGRGQRYGTLYLADKPGGFGQQDEGVVLTLAAAAAVAVQNAALYQLQVRRQRWAQAAAQISTMLLEGADAEDVLQAVADAARQVDGADGTVLILPTPDEALIVEIVSGDADDLLGLDVSDEPVVRQVFGGLDGHVSSAAAVTPGSPLGRYGPMLLAPLRTEGQGVGVLAVLRRPGALPFEPDDVELATSFAQQAALAFVLAEAQHLRGQAALRGERARIARDLHDLAIQQLFAAGMQVEAVSSNPSEPVGAGVARALDEVTEHIDAGIRQIRVIVRALDDPDASVPLVARIRAEVEIARGALGFTPALSVQVDGVELDVEDEGEPAGPVDALVAPGRANNVVAVVREGLANVARHARSRRVDVRLRVTSGPGGSVVVEVEDDGVGVPAAPERSSGTKNLALRAQEAGGSFSLLRPPSGRGALLRWSAPLD
ncbi:MAG: histidine kinase [Cellulomonas sp. 73-145]|nr:GAF domain-containing protein [Cellulomonas sp.]OJV59315.1 MAG: histidine kinase [Cellulomonas sp. 73-145]